MYRNLLAPIQRLFRREAGIFEPASIEEFDETILGTAPDQSGNRVDDFS